MEPWAFRKMLIEKEISKIDGLQSFYCSKLLTSILESKSNDRDKRRILRWLHHIVDEIEIDQSRLRFLGDTVKEFYEKNT